MASKDLVKGYCKESKCEYDVYTKEKMDELLEDTTGMIGDKYSSSSTYSKGDLTIYNNAIYKCNNDITTAEEWNLSHWTETSLNDEIKNKLDKENVKTTSTSSDNATYSCNYINNSNKYSTTEETDTGMKWIDGKKIYRKVITLSPTSIVGVYSHNIANFSQAIRCYGFAHVLQGETELTIPIPFISQNDSTTSTTSPNDGNISIDWITTQNFCIAFSSNWNNKSTGEFRPYDVHIVLEYTKNEV